MHKHLRMLIAGVVAGFLAIGLATSASSAEKKSDPTGTWKWSVTTKTGSMEQTLKLKLDGDKLTGNMIGRNGQETAIEEATLKGDEIAFQVTRERGGNKMVSKYKGKISGDTIKGTIEMEAGGKTRPARDWEAKKEAK